MPLGRETKTLVTIAIPTFNRAEMLRAVLSKICKLPTGNWNVLISDNGSTDHTHEVLMDSAATFPHPLECIRNITNLGFDANIEALVAATKSEYIWFLSDDDEIDSRTFQATLLVLEEEKPNLLIGHEIANTKLIQSHFKKLDLVPYSPSGNKLKFNLGLSEFASLDERKRVALVNQCGQISTTIIRIEGLEHSLQPVGTGIHHLTYVNQALMCRPSIYVAPWPTVRIGTKRDFSRWFMESTLYGVNDFFTHTATGVSENLQDIVVYRALRFAIGLWGRSQLGLLELSDRHSKQELCQAVSRSCTSQENKVRLLNLIRVWDKVADFTILGRPGVLVFDSLKSVPDLVKGVLARLF